MRQLLKFIGLIIFALSPLGTVSFIGVLGLLVGLGVFLIGSVLDYEQRTARKVKSNRSIIPTIQNSILFLVGITLISMAFKQVYFWVFPYSEGIGLGIYVWTFVAIVCALASEFVMFKLTESPH